jgi:hypothetical protein
MLATFKSCPQLFKKIYIDQWKSKDRSVHLHAGGAFAHGLERARRAFFEEGMEADDAVADGMRALLKFYGDFECPEDSAKSAGRTAGALEYYFSNYPLQQGVDDPIILPGGKRGIEFSFAHPLPITHPETGNPLLYCGRMDMIMNYADGVFIEDDKTTTSLGATWSKQWDLRAQFTGYAWGCREAGIKVHGVVVRGVSILKTKYDTQAPISYRPEWQVDRWFNELLDWIGAIQRCYDTNKWLYNLDHSCADYGGCAFRSACLSQDEAPWLETYFERRHWNPITREETKL